MTLLANRRVLVIGEDNSNITALCNELKTLNVSVLKTECEDVDNDFLTKNSVDLAIINNLSETDSCVNLLRSLKSDGLSTPVPVFSLVNENTEEIERTLLYGAADYITENEDVQSIRQKIEAVISEEHLFSGGSAIDITNIEASVSTEGVKVFVIEDDPLLRNLLSIRLEKSSFPVEFSTDGKDVIPAMTQFSPNVIILDLMLPGRSGFEVLREIKSDETLKGVPVIVFSNRDSSEDKQRAVELGADQFRVKAMTDLSELVENIESLAQKSN